MALPPDFYTGMDRARQARQAAEANELKVQAMQDAHKARLAAERARVEQLCQWAKTLGPLALRTGVRTDIDQYRSKRQHRIIGRDRTTQEFVTSGWRLISNHVSLAVNSGGSSVADAIYAREPGPPPPPCIKGIWLKPDGSLTGYVSQLEPGKRCTTHESNPNPIVSPDNLAQDDYGNWGELWDYMGRTANPINTLEMALFDFADRHRAQLGL